MISTFSKNREYGDAVIVSKMDQGA